MGKFGEIMLSSEIAMLPQIDLEATPSRIHGLDSRAEKDLRMIGCELIQTSGILLRLPQVAMATGQILFQRFYYSKSFIRYDMEVIAISCIFVASKIEENPRMMRDVLNVFHHMKQIRNQKIIEPLNLDQSYMALNERVMNAECLILKVLGFCVHVKHPHKLILMYLQVLGFEKNQKFMQCAWNYMNDSLRTDIFVRHQPETIACGCIYLAARTTNTPLPNNPPWYEIFKVNKDDIIDICYRISELYHRAKPNIEELELTVQKLKIAYMESRDQKRLEQIKLSTITTSTNATTAVKTDDQNAYGDVVSDIVKVTHETKPVNATKLCRSRSITPSNNTDKKLRYYERSSSSDKRAAIRESRTVTPTNNNKKRSRNYERSPSHKRASIRETTTKRYQYRSRRSRSTTPTNNNKKKSRNYEISPSSASYKRADFRETTTKRCQYRSRQRTL